MTSPAAAPPSHRPLPRLPAGFGASLHRDVDFLRREGQPETPAQQHAALELGLTLLIAGAVLLVLLVVVYAVSLVRAPRPHLEPARPSAATP